MPAYKGEHDDILKPFFDAMRFKLAKNKHKGTSFEAMSYEGMFKRMNDEVAELKEAIEGGNQFEIIFEAADIANFALFIATKAIRETIKTDTTYYRPCCIEQCGCTIFVPSNNDASTCSYCHHAVSRHVKRD